MLSSRAKPQFKPECDAVKTDLGNSVMKILAGALLISAAAFAQTPQPDNLGPNPNIVRETAGTMTFRQIADGRVRGHEYFRVTQHRDGTRTMNITKDLAAANAFQTIVVRAAADFRPLEVYAAYWTGEGYKGSITVTLDGERLRAVSASPLGTNTYDIRVPEKLSVVTHGEIMNGWYLWSEDPKASGEQTAMSFNLNAGARGNAPVTGLVHPSTFKRIGSETVKTEAGTFDTVRYDLDGLQMWIGTIDRLLVRQVDPKAGREYVLTEIKVTESAR